MNGLGIIHVPGTPQIPTIPGIHSTYFWAPPKFSVSRGLTPGRVIGPVLLRSVHRMSDVRCLLARAGVERNYLLGVRIQRQP